MIEIIELLIPLENELDSLRHSNHHEYYQTNPYTPYMRNLLHNKITPLATEYQNLFNQLNPNYYTKYQQYHKNKKVNNYVTKTDSKIINKIFNTSP